MPVELEIRDGNPWWMSPDIWTVPGEDPEAPAGVPIAGSPCFLWAHVRNNGTSSVTNAMVRFYWANPSAGFDRNTANLIGTSNVNLIPGESADVLCLAPWIPEYVNGGHECVLAEAFHTSLDPLPAAPDFNVPTDRHVAQRNLHVVQAARGFFAFPFVLYNTVRTAGRFEVTVHQASIKDLAPLRRRLGIELPTKDGKLVQSAFVDERCPTAERLDGCQGDKLDVHIPGRGSRASTLIGRIESPAALVHITQRRAGRVVGGLSLLVHE